MAAEKDVKIVTGEESERLVWKNRCKLYRFGGGEWKQRGTGDVTYLQHIENGNIRIVMRQEKTGKVVMNHYVNPSEANKLEENFGNQKSRVWSTIDFSDDGQDKMSFAIRFAKEEEASTFEEFFNKAKVINGSDEKKEKLAEFVDPLYSDEPEKVAISLENKDDTPATEAADAASSKPAAAAAAAEEEAAPKKSDDAKEAPAAAAAKSEDKSGEASDADKADESAAAEE